MVRAFYFFERTTRKDNMNTYDEEVNLFLNSLNFRGQIGNSSRTAYIKYKKGERFPDDYLDEVRIVEILDDLGFSIDEVGTFLYAKMILSVLAYLREIPIRGIVLSEEELNEQLENAFSQFYLDIARNDLDIGIKTFHFSIKRALLKVDLDSVDRKLATTILGDNFDISDYSHNALAIAKYLNIKFRRCDEQNIPVRRKPCRVVTLK